jgi:hypothetical protein
MASTIAAGTTSGTAIAIAGDTSGVLQLQTNGTTAAVTIDTSQNVGIGTSSPSEKLEINNGNLAVGNAGNNFTMKVLRTGANASSVVVGAFTNEPDIQWTYTGSGALRFTDSTASAERMRITSSGALLVNRTTQVNTERFAITGNTSSQCMALVSPITGGYDMCTMNNGNGQVGLISTSGTSTAYTTSSDYRLKENIAPMTGALNTISALKPCTYKWKIDGSNGQGFIAHELAEIVPECVTGEKDAVKTIDDLDEDGKVIGSKEVPVHQGIDTSFLVATLTAALQELNAKVEAQAVRIAELEGAK